MLRIPIGIFLDNRPSERDDYWFLVTGFFLAALVPLGYIFTYCVWHLYLLQIINAVAMAMGLSGWQAIFARHIDKGKEATELGLDATSVGLGIGISGAVGGWVAMQFGFNALFIGVSVIGLIGVAILLYLKNDIKGVFDNGFSFNLKKIFSK